MKHKIDPTVDCVFKAILGKENHKNLLIHFLNAVLELPAEEKITEVSIMNPYNEREFETDKLSIVDIRAKDEMDNNYQVEIQISLHANLPPRMLYMWSTVYHSLLSKGDSYSLLTPVISIWILTGSLFPKTGDCHLSFRAWNQKHNIMLCDHFAIHVLQLPEWREDSAGLTEKDRWLYFFKEGKNTDPDDPPEILNTDEMRQAMGVIKDFSENQKNYLLYQDRLAALSEIATWKAELETALRKAEKAEKEKEKAEREKEKAVKKVQKEKEKAEKEKEKAEKEKEKALKEVQKEKKKLLLLLKKAGIDPDQPEH
ncbi:MAG: Rpn family recombination-promoting nuclease/putative transposase [Desulfobacterales bacterium]|nr:Rpn family recombination-promoting nuclease/putative transposase [Desulfobacterales bacterium]